MKILDINIIEFGGLQNYTRTFDKGANVIFEKNGFGKTTIAAFIKAMLYGFQNAKGADVSKNMRLKMTPWSGNDFGGTMTVETDGGKRLRIERVFNAHGYMDIVNVVNADTNAAENDYLPVPGEKLLGVGSDNFERCVYTPQSAVRTGNDGGLTARLGRALEDNGGGASLSRAVKVLDSYLDVLASNEGRLLKTTGEIAKVEKQIRIADAKRAAQLAGVKKRADLKAKLIKYEAEAELINTSRIPQIELNKTAALYQRIDRQRQEKLRQVEAMNEYLRPRVLNADEKAEINGYINRIEELKAINAAREKEEKAKAAESKPAEEKPVKAAAIKTQAVREKLRRKQGDKKKMLVLWTVFAAAVLCVIGAIVNFALSRFLDGGLFAGAAVISGAAAFLLFMMMRREAENERARILAEEERARKEQLEREAAEQETREAEKSVTAVTADGASQAAVDRNEEALITEKALMIAAKAIIGVDTVEQLKRSMQTYDSDVEAREAALKEADEFEVTLQSIKKDLKGADESIFARKFMEEDFDLKIPQKRLKFLDTAIKNIIAEVGRIEGSQSAGLEGSLHRTELKQLHNNLLKDREEMEYIIYCVDNAVFHLNEGREQLHSNYAPPLKNSLAGYLKELSFGKNTGITLDKDLNICIESDGEPHEIDYYSQGLQDLTYFALRMSMLDLIYKTESPFIVLDEPFVNFDDNHMEQAKNLLQKIAKDKQVIYMTSQAAHRI